MEVQVGPPVLAIHADDHVMVCEANGHISSTAEQGYFVRDTRLVSGYRLKLGRAYPVLLNSSEVEACSARFEFTNPSLETAGGPVAAGSLHLRLDRAIRGLHDDFDVGHPDHTAGRGLHEDYDLVNYSSEPIEILLEVSLESDFADIFDVKFGRRLRRGSIQSTWDEQRSVLATYYDNQTFRRGIEIHATRTPSLTQYANGAIAWKIQLTPGGSWHACLLWSVDLGDGPQAGPDRRCHLLASHHATGGRARKRWTAATTSYWTSDPTLNTVVAQAVEDLAGLQMHLHDDVAAPWGNGHTDPSSWVPAAGIPWFVSLFGRDALVVSLQTLGLSPRFALGTLRALARLQANAYDDERDMQPGKIEHEVRHGELAALRLIPHTPYYGTHESTTLFVWAVAQAWRWHGDQTELDALRPHVERALEWIEHDGDFDGDGLQEYKTRAKSGGYYNQGWKDAGDAIVDERGKLAELPIALCEHQGYVVAAKRDWAEVLAHVYGETDEAARLRIEADQLAATIEELFWWEKESTYFLGLDGSKRPLRTVASNPAHLLWSGAIRPERARRTAERLLASDMWSGWGIRTLSESHPSYNPFSYQLGSVWPHDNVIAAAGFRRYGLDHHAVRVLRAVFDAAARFRSSRLPELFAGIRRDPGGFPVQYLGANVPQAWASGAVIHAVSVLLGLQADAQKGVLTLRPALPDWLSEMHLSNLGVGSARVDLAVSKSPSGGPSLEVGRSDDILVHLDAGQ